MSLAFNPAATAFSGNGARSRRENFPVKHVTVRGFPMITNKSSFAVKCNLTTTDLMGKIAEKFKGEDSNFPAAAAVQPAADIPSNLCIIDTLQRLGVDRYFRPEIDTILEGTYRLWQRKERAIFSDTAIHAMAFRLLRVKGYEVSSEELAPYADQEHVDLQTIEVATVIELYRAAQERTGEEESSLKKLHAWTTTFLKQKLLTNSIPDKKLHKLVEYYLKNYHGILDRMGVRQNLDLYDISYYRTAKAANRFSNLRSEDFLAFARQDFNICQAQHQKELQQLQRWYADCKLDTLKYGRDVVRVANFLTSAIIGDPELSDVRIVFAQHIVLVTRIDDFFDHRGSREESYKILELIKEWKEKPAAEYGSEEVEILFTAVYNTVNELAERAHVEQGRSVKDFLIKLWVQILTIFKRELDTWSDDTALTLDDYLSASWVSIGCRICILMSMQFIGIKLSDEMLLSEECIDLCRHVSMVDRLLNDVQTFEKERKENTGNSVTLLLAANKDDSSFTEEEAIRIAKEMAECNRRQLMQIVYKTGTIFPRQCKDMFLKVCRIGCYLYASGDEFTSPQQMMEDMKSLVYEPLTIHPLVANNVRGK
ncbi:miltiradiene synthase KSL1, chloroplastic [Salvia miltiorrhiza]|uniref:miltiradiene synthase KSL1, chloroplastic n=1 Tax=Salvia miltiorrhiza TaxID=226208 RepID=UPI0025AD6243|nr:miltiradiene synthase KSL1, chloroplastic [Salvia miltiorrhiza]